MKPSDLWLQEVVSAVSVAAQDVIRALPPGANYRGGYFTLIDTAIGLPPLIRRQIGEIEDPSLRLGCYNISCEKAERLIAHPHHVSSWITRSEDLGQYGGAIRAGNCNIAFSGLSEHADEAVCLPRCQCEFPPFVPYTLRRMMSDPRARCRSSSV